MRRLISLVWALCLAGTLVTSCGLPGSGAVTYTQYQLTCCTTADIDQVWQPGTTVELHWIVISSTTTTFHTTHKVVVTATLIGPSATRAR